MRKYESKTKVKLNARKLIHLRAKRQWTQKTAAMKAKVSLPTYGSAERGHEIQAAKAGKIAALYRMELEELEQKSA